MYAKLKAKIKTSIQCKLVAGLIGIGIVPLMIMAVMCITSDKIEAIYKQDLDTHIVYSEMFLTLEQLISELEQYSKTGKAYHYETYKEMVSHLLQKAEQLQHNQRGTINQREAIDLNYMVDNYVEQAECVIQAIQVKDYEVALETLEVVKHLNKLITEKCNDLYRNVSADTLQVRGRVEVAKRMVRILIISLLVGGGIVGALLIRYITKNFIQPIQRLQEATEQFALLEGQYTFMQVAEDAMEDEIGRLERDFYNMQQKIVEQVEALQENMAMKRKLDEAQLNQLRVEKLLKESELKALQARINPHFIFNSLNLIVNMAYIEGAEETAGLMEALADFLRYNLDKFSKVVTLKDELDNIKDYFAIQSRRFGQRITFIVEEDSSAEATMLPCLIIQPLVENAIIHGVGMYTQDGVVGVQIKKEKDYVRITIYDNGVGMDAEKLRAVNAISYEICEQEEVHIGLHNVFSRLKIFFNNKVKIEVSSEPGIQTTFNLWIPYEV